MSSFTVQRYCTKNDSNGNPRRVFVIRDDSGSVVRTVAEGYAGDRAAAIALEQLGVDRQDSESPRLGSWWTHHHSVTDLGSVDVSPGVYRRMLNYRIGQDD